MKSATTSLEVTPRSAAAPVTSAALPDFEAERRATLQLQAPAAVAVLLACAWTWGVIEWFHRPLHRSALVTVDLLLILACCGPLAFGRRFPRYSATSSIVGVNACIACILLYTALVRGSGELNVMAITLMLGGTVALLPLGARNQLLASVAAIVGYPLILQLGAKTYLDPWYSLAGLVAAVGVAALGAGTIDQYRRRILHQADVNAQLVRAANAAHEAKSEFLATVAHELRNPLGAIIGYADLLRDGAFPDPQEADDALKRIHGQAFGMLDMLQNLLDIDRIEAGEIRIDAADADLAQILADVRASVPPSWEKPGITLAWDLPVTPVPLRTDARKLASIVRNLIHNAIKHTHAGSVKIAACRDAGGAVVLRVEDTGEGIPADDLPHIFDRFRQSQNPAHGGGVGLGLHIVKRFSEALGASVDATSEVGRGTRFVLTLPAGPPTQG
jgi:signal transduction histidine kinase